MVENGMCGFHGKMERYRYDIDVHVHEIVYDLKQMEIYYQWPFQEPKLEVPTIYKAYIRHI